MKHVKLFEDFSISTFLTEEQISWLDKCTTEGWKLNPSTGLVDVIENFGCLGQSLTDFKGVRFGHIKGIFRCSNNRLTNLEGAPQAVDGDFNCSSNQLTSLEGAPESVGGDFNCSRNQLTSLEGAPLTVGKHFYCADNQITSLEGAPESVGMFSISWSRIGLLDWSKGWSKKGDKEFIKTLIFKLKKINDLGPELDKEKSELKEMLISLTGQPDLLEYLLSLRLSTSDKFEIYGILKDSFPDVWYKIKDEVDPEGDTSDLMDLGF